MLVPILVIFMLVLPVLMIVKRRSSGVIVFLGLCLGFLLASHLASDFADVITAATRGDMLATTQWAQLALLFIPFYLAIVFTKNVGTPGGPLAGLFMAIIASSLFVLLATYYLPVDWRNSVQATFVWGQLDNLMTLFLISGGVITLLGLRGKNNSSKSGKKTKH